MGTLSKGYTFGSTELVTNTKLHSLIDSATITAIVNADISATAAIVDTKLAQITTADKVSGAALVAGSVTNAGLAQITTADKVSGSALTDIIFYENDLVSSDNTIVYD